MLTEKFTALNEYIKKEAKSQIKNQSFYFENLGRAGWGASRRKR